MVNKTIERRMTMKKVFAIALALTMLVSLTACGQAETADAHYVETQRTVEVFSGEELLSENRTEYTHDAFGNVTEMKSYQNGTLYETEKADELDENGRPVKLTATNIATGETFTKTVEYDADGNAVKTVYWAGEAVSRSYTRTFDEAGRLTSLVTVEPAAGLSSTTMTYTYNEDGTLASLLVDYGANGAVLMTYEYDSLGREIKETAYEGKTTSDPVRDYTESTYAADGKRTKTTTPVSGNTLGGSTVITYDEAGNEICKEVYNEEGVLSIRTTSVYKKLS